MTSQLYGAFGQNVNEVGYMNVIKPIKKPIYNDNKPFWLRDNHDVIFFYDGQNWKICVVQIFLIHQIVWDKYLGQDISITYCPLTDASIIYKKHMGHSGLIFNSNMVLYRYSDDDDHWLPENSELICQITGEYLNTKRKGTSLAQLIPYRTTYGKIIKLLNKINIKPLYLEGLPDIEYNIHLFRQYDNKPLTLFPIKHKLPDQTIAKKKVIGIINNGKPYMLCNINMCKLVDGYIVFLEDYGLTYFIKEIDGSLPVPQFNKSRNVPIQMYGFAWYTFYPESCQQ